MLQCVAPVELLTGVRGSNSRFYNSRVDEDLPKAVTLAKLFKQNGYSKNLS